MEKRIMSKTPEEMAGEYAHANTSYGHSYSIARGAFLAGYKAAKDEEATKDQKIAELWTESIKKMLPSVHEITLFPSKPSEEK